MPTSHTHRRTPDERVALQIDGTSHVPATLPLELTSNALNAPSTLMMQRSTSFPSGGFGSQGAVNEPSVGTIQDTIFQTGNWYAARSTDNGATWMFVDPFALFPPTPYPFNAGFCCDQRVAQDPTRGLLFWYLQYVETGSLSTDTNGVRLAVADAAAVATNGWWYYNITPSSFGFPAGYAFDFPHLEVSANYLYITTNIFSTSTNTFASAMIARIPIATLAAKAPGSAQIATYSTIGSITTVNGPTTTAYFGARNGPTAVAVIKWPESSAAPATPVNINLAGTTFSATFTCVGPDGRDPCTRADMRMQTGWLSGNELGLMWSSAQSGANGRPYPFTRVVTLDATTLVPTSDSDLWNPATALLYPAVAVNARGHQGGIISVLGGNQVPTMMALMRDDYTAGSWSVSPLLGSVYGTNGLWGDYNGVAVHTKYPNTWVIGGHVQLEIPNGRNATGQNAWIMRQRDASIAVTALTSNLAFPVTAGTPVTWTATTAGGVAPYSYQFWVFDGVSWTVGQSWSASNTFRWRPPFPGSYTVQVWVRSAGSTNTLDAWRNATASVAVPTALTVTAIAPSPAAVSAGTQVTWTAAAAGGTGPYTYQFWLFDGEQWTLAQDWSATNTWSFRPAAAGTYNVQVWVRNAGSGSQYDAWAASDPLTVALPTSLVVTRLEHSASPVPAGTPVTWTANALGGVGPYTYMFWLFDGSAWSVGQDWSSSSTWTWTPSAVGTYAVQVWVRNAASAATYDAWLGSDSFVVTPAAPLTLTNVTWSVTNVPSAISVPAGTPVNWSAQAVGGTGPYTYKFWLFNGTAWSIGRDWSADSTWTWIPATAGTYSVQVWARNAGSAAEYDAWRAGGPVAILPTAPIAVKAFTTYPSSPFVVGGDVIVAATAVGGAGPYTYKLWVFDGTSWNVVSDWSPTHQWRWTPAAPGTYSFQVWVRNAGSAATWDTWAPLGPVTVVP
jgi:hypothetical protein